ncbi:hypothetical protein T492DRAFT_996381 [Pavlovales sp. CCMP2436]|nr:hypothetical protein T492DRAFT_996381 [Pavlovales sp. CCMP2436]
MDPLAEFARQHERNKQEKAATGLTAGRAAGATLADRGRLSAAALPWDWSLKQGCQVSSHVPLAWCSRLRAEVECQALADACAPPPARPPAADSARSVEEAAAAAYARALMYWSFQPNAPPTAGGGDAARGGQGQQQQQQQAEWVEALRSAYFELRHCALPYFYLQLPNGTTVFWRNAAVPAWRDEPALATAGGGAFEPVAELCEQSLYALVCRPTAALALALRDGGVPFEVQVPAPLAATAAAVLRGRVTLGGGDEEGAQGDEPLDAPSSPARPAAPPSGRPAGPLLLAGHEGVHGLFDVLAADTPPEQAAAARLYAPGPFVNATCRRLRLQRAGPLLQRADSASAAENASGRALGAAGPRVESVHSLELSGPLLPSALRALCQALDAAQGGAFKLRARPADGTQQLNAVAPEWAGGEGGGVDAPLKPLGYAEVERAGGQWKLTLALPGARDGRAVAGGRRG